MAEALSVVAGGIAVQQAAGQVLTAVIRLKQLWDQVQDAPDRISYLLDDLIIYSSLLAEMEGQLTDGTPSPTAQRSARLCQQTLDQLENIASNLQKQLDSPRRSKRLLGAVKVVLSDDRLKQYQERMDQAFRWLQISHQCHISASTKLLPDIIAKRMNVEIQHLNQVNKLIVVDDTSSPKVSESDDLVPGIEAYATTTTIDHVASRSGPDTKRRTLRTKRIKSIALGLLVVETLDGSGYKVSFTPPNWLLRRDFEVQATRALGGWQYLFRQRNQISDAAKTCLWLDDHCGLRQLFDQRLASPYDRDGTWEREISFLEVAFRAGAKNVIQMLLESGWAEDDDADAIMYDFRISGFYLQFLRLRSRSNLSRIVKVLDDYGYTTGEPDSTFPIGDFFGIFDADDETARAFKLAYCPQYHWLSPKERLEISRSLVTGTVLISPETFLHFIDSGSQSTENLVLESIRHGTSIIISIASSIGSVYSQAWWGHKLMVAGPEVLVEKWHDFAVAMISEKCDLHSIETCRWKQKIHGLWETEVAVTPLWSTIMGAITVPNTFVLGPRLDLDPWMGSCPIILPAGFSGKLGWINRAAVTAIEVVVEWLRILFKCGVDLTQYGTREKQLMDPGKRFENVEFELWDTLGAWHELAQGSWPYIMRVMSFQFGPTPEDWHFWWAIEYETFARDFWELLERPVVTMPGSWIE